MILCQCFDILFSIQAVIESMTPVVDKYSDLSSCLFMIDTKGDGSKDSTEIKETGATPISDQPIKKLKRRNAAMYASESND